MNSSADGPAEISEEARPGGPAPGPFLDRRPDHTDSVEHLDMLSRAGIRPLPFPFASAVALASDVDGSMRDTYERYRTILVDELGLDFGDSTWLHWRYAQLPGLSNSLGFFSPNLTFGSSEPATRYNRTRTFREGISEYHAGMIDHFHALLPHGPRVLPLEGTAEGNILRVKVPELELSGPWGCFDVHVFGIAIVSEGRDLPDIERVEVRTINGDAFGGYVKTETYSLGERNYSVFAALGSANHEIAIPSAREVESLAVVAVESFPADRSVRVLLLSTYGPLLLDRLKLLRYDYGVEMGLVTEHAAQHFRNPIPALRKDLLSKEHFQSGSESAGSYCGRMVDHCGATLFSMDADEPRSFGRVLPEMASELELRFVVPLPASKSTGLTAVELISPSPTRAGGGIYWARRVMTNIEEPKEGKRFEGKTQLSSFTGRLARLLEGAAAEPGLFWPLYTHLGTIPRQGMKGGQRILPEPYFERAPLLELQNRAFGMSGDVPSGHRIWFARASVLYDYGLMLRSIAASLDRGEEDVVAIRSWLDETLGKRLPRSPAQLYGLTFYVNDAARARVTLDGREIETIVRNPPDTTGRPSVTIAECEIRSTLFRSMDPTNAGDARVERGKWRWLVSKEGRAHGRLTPADLRAAATLRVPMHGFATPGAQVLSCRVAVEPEAALGLLLETESGGRFWFGTGTFDEVEHVDAAYTIEQPAVSARSSFRFVAPFHDLRWAAGARAGGPLPSHPLKAVTLFASGGTADFAELELLRPRATARAREGAEGCCVAGIVEGAGLGEVVILERADSPHQPLSCETDQRGWFCFPGVSPGVYRCFSRGAERERVGRRGPLIEVWSDVPALRLA